MEHLRSWLAFVLSLLSGICVSDACQAREWTDVTGRYSWDAELFAASEDVAILRDRRGKLQGVKVAELSDEGKAAVTQYLKRVDTDPEGTLQTWTGQSGVRIRGQVLGYKSGPVEIESRSSVPYVNRKRMRDIDPVYQAMIPKLVAHFDDPAVETMDDFNRWVRRLRGGKKTVQVDGVLMKLESGDEYAIPLFMFAEKHRKVLETGWKQWSDEKATEKQRAQEDLLVRSEAAAYQRQKDEQNRRHEQIQMMQLGLLAVDAGITSLWQVQLLPANGYGRPVSVVVPAINSGEARAKAMQKYPGYRVGASVQVSRR